MVRPIRVPGSARTTRTHAPNGSRPTSRLKRARSPRPNGSVVVIRAPVSLRSITSPWLITGSDNSRSARAGWRGWRRLSNGFTSACGDIAGVIEVDEWSQILRLSAKELQPYEIPVVQMCRAHVADPSAYGRQVPIALQRDVEDCLGLQRGGGFNEGSSEADVEKANWPLTRERPGQATHNLETTFRPSIGHGWWVSAGASTSDKWQASSRNRRLDAITIL